MKKAINLAVVAALMFGSGAAAFAQYAAGDNEAGLIIGAAIPRTKTDLTSVGGGKETSAKTGMNLGARYLYHISPEWAFGGEVASASYGDKEKNVNYAGTPLVVREGAKTMAFEGLAKYTFQPEKKTRPYLLGGLGYGRTTWKGETKPGAGYVWADTSTSEYRTNFDEDMSALSFSFGAGLETTMSENISLAFEARWRTIRADDTIADKLFPLKWEAEAANAFLLTAGLNWKFGK